MLDPQNRNHYCKVMIAHIELRVLCFMIHLQPMYYSLRKATAMTLNNKQHQTESVVIVKPNPQWRDLLRI